MEQIIEYLPVLIPIAIIQLGLLIAAWVHIFTHDTYRTGTRTLWALVSLINIIGPVMYFVIGRDDS